MLKTLQNLNLALAFALELCGLAALWVWAYQIDAGEVVKIGLAVVVVLVAAVLWGMFVAPRAARPVSTPVRLGLKALFFGLGMIGLIISGHTLLGVLLAVLAAVNLGLAQLWRQDVLVTTRRQLD